MKVIAVLVGFVVLFCLCSSVVFAQLMSPDIVWMRNAPYDRVKCVAFSPDGQTLATGEDANGVLKLWRVCDGALQLTLMERNGGGINCVAFSPDGKTLASGSDDRTIKLWRVSDGTLLRTLIGHTGEVSSVAFSPDGETLASGSRDKTINLWRVSDGLMKQTLTGHTGLVLSVAFSPDGQTLASGSGDKTINIWNVADNTLQRTLTGHTYYVWSVAFSPDGQTLASGSLDGTIKLWRLSVGACLWTLPNMGSYVYSVVFSPDGLTLASGSSDKTIKLWRVSDANLLLTMEGHDDYVRTVAFSPDGKMLASGSDDRTFKLWRVSDGALLQTPTGHRSYVSCIAFSNDGRTLASGGDAIIKLWRVTDGVLLQNLTGHTNGVNSIAFSPDDQTLVSVGYDGDVKLWNVTDGTLQRTITAHTEAVYSVAFSPDGQILATGDYDGNIKLWRVSDGTLLQTLTGHDDFVLSVAFSPDGQTLAGTGRSIKLWRVSDGVLLRTLSGHSLTVHSVIFSPDGQTLASGASDHTIKLWRISDGTLLRTLTGHTDDVHSVSYSPDGQTLASGSYDRTLKLWNISDGSVVTLKSTETSAYNVQYSPTGKYLAFGRDDGAVVMALSPTGYALFPQEVGNVAHAKVSIFWVKNVAMFADGMTAKLSGNGIPDIPAQSVRILSERLMEVDFNLTDAPLGMRSVVVQTTAATPSSLVSTLDVSGASSGSDSNAGGLNIVSGIKQFVLPSISGPSQVRIGRTGYYTLTAMNIGNCNAYQPTTWLTVPTTIGSNPLSWSLGSGWRTSETWSDLKRVSSQRNVLVPSSPVVIGLFSLSVPNNSALIGKSFTILASANTNEAVREELTAVGYKIEPPYIPEFSGLLECSIAGMKNLANGYFAAGNNGKLQMTGGSEPHPGVGTFSHKGGYKTDVDCENVPVPKDAISKYIRSFAGVNKGASGDYLERYETGGVFYGLEAPGGTGHHWDIKWASAPSHCGGYGGDRTGKYIEIIGSIDPNDISGPLGTGTLRWVQARSPFPYTIMFENKAQATAPAADVVVTDRLDPLAFDMTSVMLGPIEFQGRIATPTLVNSPPVGPREFSADVDLRPENNLIVRVRCKLDMITGKLVWTFNSLDPNTLQPPDDPMAGFLPPGAGGQVSFSITPKDSLPTGFVVSNNAEIVFDVNEPLATPVWHNTIDNVAPFSGVLPLAAQTTNQTFTVRWTGQDDESGSGIKDFDVYVSEDNGPFKPWQVSTTQSNALFTANPGCHTYAFRSKARDITINVEATHSQPDTVTTVTTNPVPSIVNLSPNAIAVGSSEFTLGINGKDFVNGCLVKWNGVDRPTTFRSATQVTVQIPASDVVSARSSTITIANPAPGGGVSNGVVFLVGVPKLTPKVTLIRSGGQIQATVTVTNSGTASAADVNITTATLGINSASNLPISLGSIGVGTSKSTVLTFNVPAGSSSFTIKGRYQGGSYGSSLRVTVP